MELEGNIPALTPRASLAPRELDLDPFVAMRVTAYGTTPDWLCWLASWLAGWHDPAINLLHGRIYLTYCRKGLSVPGHSVSSLPAAETRSTP